MCSRRSRGAAAIGSARSRHVRLDARRASAKTDYDEMLREERERLAGILAGLQRLDASTAAGLKDARAYLKGQSQAGENVLAELKGISSKSASVNAHERVLAALEEKSGEISLAVACRMGHLLLNKAAIRVNKSLRQKQEAKDGKRPDAYSCNGVCRGSRYWKKPSDEAVPCNCADGCYWLDYLQNPDLWRKNAEDRIIMAKHFGMLEKGDWDNLDLRSCRDHFGFDATSAHNHMRDHQEAAPQLERTLMVQTLRTRTKDVPLPGGQSFWELAEKAVFPLDTASLWQVIRKAWDANKELKPPRHILSKPIVGPANYSKEQVDATLSDGQRWRRARSAYRTGLLTPLEEVWEERQRLCEYLSGKTWRPLLEHLADLHTFGQLTAGVLADHLRVAPGTFPECKRHVVTGQALVDDRKSYCYFGQTGCTKGLAAAFGVDARTIKRLRHDGQVRWLQRIFLVLERLWPDEVLREKWVPLELQSIEWASCEFSKDNDGRVSYPSPGLKRDRSKISTHKQEDPRKETDLESFEQMRRRIDKMETMFFRHRMIVYVARANKPFPEIAGDDTLLMSLMTHEGPMKKSKHSST